MLEVILSGCAGGILGLLGGIIGYSLVLRVRARTTKHIADLLVASAEREASAILKRAEIEAKEEGLKRREAVIAELESARKAIRDQERGVERQAILVEEKNLVANRREADLDAARARLSELENASRVRQGELERLVVERTGLLERASRFTSEEAREELLRQVENELDAEIGERVQKHSVRVREEAQRRAQEILSTAIQRYAAAHTAEVTVSTVDIPNDETKGRIIGREGRNIRAFEKATGVDLIVDDTPGIVVVSGFDNVRREIAKLSLEKLIQDGRIHPSRIEEVVKETQEELEAHIRTIGEQTIREAEIQNLHEQLLHYLGRLKFRTSYSQNVLRHSLEVAFLTGNMAEELGLDGALGRRCGLLHDIGKAADHEMEGGHPAVGGELLKRYGERAEVVHAATGHHDDLSVDHVYTVLVAAADAISASRPGARRDTLERYARRLEELEALALGFPGVDQAYAIQAGREVRILVDSAQVDDAASVKLCRDIAREIQGTMSYPGEVKVTVVRETRTVEFAR